MKDHFSPLYNPLDDDAQYDIQYTTNFPKVPTVYLTDLINW